MAFALVVPASAPAQDDRVADLEATVAALEERVTALEQSAPAPFVEVAGDTIAITGDENGALDPIDLPPGMYYFQLACERGQSYLSGDHVNGDFFGLSASDGVRLFEEIKGTFVLTVACYERTPWTVTIQAP
jgi:hypothetical protein